MIFVRRVWPLSSSSCCAGGASPDRLSRQDLRETRLLTRAAFHSSHAHTYILLLAYTLLLWIHYIISLMGMLSYTYSSPRVPWTHIKNSPMTWSKSTSSFDPSSYCSPMTPCSTTCAWFHRPHIRSFWADCATSSPHHPSLSLWQASLGSLGEQSFSS